MDRRDLTIGMVTAGILILCVASACLLNRHGRQARTYAGPAYALTDPALPVTIVETADELYKFFRTRKVRGRIMVHVGKYLHSVDIDSAQLIPSDDRYPAAIRDELTLYEERISYRNVLWVSGQANILREIFYYQPPVSFNRRLEAVDDRDPDLISKSADAIVLHDWGSRRTITDRVPMTTEPVLLNIDASVFEELRPEQLLSALRSSSLTSDLITLNVSRDNPDITDAARKSLLLFGAMMGKKGHR